MFKYLLLFVCFLIITGCSLIKEREIEPPQPSKDLETYISHVIPNWLNVRMDQITWVLFSRNSWKEAQSLIELSNWFQNNLGKPLEQEDLWNFQQLMDSIQNTSLYQQEMPSPQRLLALLKEALSSYQFERGTNE